MNNKTKNVIKEKYSYIDYKTNIFGKTNYEILQSLKGQITDGYWENSWKLNSIMNNIEFTINDDNEIIVRSYLTNSDEQTIRTFLAKYLKLLMKAYFKANPEYGKFNKDNTRKINNWFHKPEPLVCEVYDLYRLLLNKPITSDVIEEKLNSKEKNIGEQIAEFISDNITTGPYRNEKPKVFADTIRMYSEEDPGSFYTFNDDGSIDALVSDEHYNISKKHYIDFKELCSGEDSWFAYFDKQCPEAEYFIYSLLDTEIIVESLKLSANLTESLSQDEKEFFLNLIDELDAENYLDEKLCNDSIAIKKDKITQFKEEYRDKIEDNYIDTFSSLLHPKTWQNLSDFHFDDHRSFWDSHQISHITIPNGVTTIGDWAFNECIALKSITIPNSVTSIGDCALYDCESLKSITIPNSVTSIGDWAFFQCIALKSITIPNSVTSIGESAFAHCYSLQSITLPNTLTTISYRLFYNCKSLQSTTIPNSVTVIGDYAFYECTSLESITIPNSVTSIGDWAFFQCIALKSITIPNSVTSIGEWPFENCSSLKSITLEKGIDNEIVNQLNRQYPNIKIVLEENLNEAILIEAPEKVSESLTSLPYEIRNFKSKDFEKNFLNNARSHKENYRTAYDGDNYYIYKRENRKLKLIMTYISSLTVLSFFNYDYLNELENLDNELVEALHPEINLGWNGEGKRHLVDADTFTTKQKDDIIEIEISKDLPTLKYKVKDGSYLDDEAAKTSWFNDEAAQYDSDIDDRIEFNDALTKLIKDKVNNAIKDTIKPEYADSGLYVYQGGSFGAVPADISLQASNKKRIPALIDDKDEIIENVIQASKRLSEAKVVDNVSKMTCGYITDDGKLLELNEYHGEDKDINNLNYIEFSNTHPEDDTCVRIYKEPTDKQYIQLEKILDKYLQWENYCKIEISENKHHYNYYKIFSIFEGACSDSIDTEEIVGNWTGYKLIRIIKEYFNKNRNITEAIDVFNESYSEDFKSKLEDFLNKLYEEQYIDIDNLSHGIYFYANKINDFIDSDLYKNWMTSSEQADFLCSKLNAKTWDLFIKKYAFSRCKSLQSITIPNSVTSIGKWAFSGCKALKSVSIPNSVTSIGDSAFYNCKSLKSITIPNSLTNIGKNAFSDCKSLQSITIPNSVTSIGDCALYDCESLKSITIPNSVTSIGDCAFNGCISLKSITLEKGIDSKIVNKLNFQYPNKKIVLEENLNESILIEAPEKHDTLNPKLWDIETNTLKPEVKEKIMQIVKDFCDDLENDEIKFNLKDVKLVGSNCSYNYNEKSDLDIHLVMDTKSLKCPDNLYPLLYSAYRSIWNKNHDIDFYGIPVEIFVETDDTEDLNN